MGESAAGLADAAIVAVVGAGTMGRGITEVAARAGHPVVLFDARPGATSEALDAIRRRLGREVERHRMEPEEAARTEGRIDAADSLEALSGAGLVVEAIVEQIDVKQDLFRTLDALVGSDTLFATNTSSLSVAEIGGATTRADRFAGLHFFNPAPRMPLVEVVTTSSTSPNTVATLTATARRWGKTPVVCADTPGFIVNRVARPFYLEALAILDRGEVEPARLDAAFRGAGFPMGPCELLDLIGLDVNLAVSESVYHALGDEPRIRPSPLQRRLVAEGRLGRKTDRGFYDYPQGRHEVAVHPPGGFSTLQLTGDPGHGAGLVERLTAAHGLERDTGAAGTGLIVDGWRVEPAPGSSDAAVIFDVVADWSQTRTVGAAGSDVALDAFAAVCATVGVGVIRMPERCGDVVMRTVAMLVAMAAEAVDAGVAEPRDIDTALRLGVNHPLGPFEWRDALGEDVVAATLRDLSDRYDAERYRPVGS